MGFVFLNLSTPVLLALLFIGVKSVKNVNLSICISLTALRLFGFWAPEDMTARGKLLYGFYGFFSFMFLLGTYIIIQVVDMFMIWGNLPLMTGTAFLLFTNLAQFAKLVNLITKKEKIATIIREADQLLKSENMDEGRRVVALCNRETVRQQLLYVILTIVTMTGWASSAEKNQLPLRAWYPYDTSTSPGYELTYLHQVFALFVAANLNVSKDTLVIALIAQCKCRLRLLGLALRRLCKDMKLGVDMLLPAAQQTIVNERLRSCVAHHQAALLASKQLQSCFSEPTFAQFTVSLVIICVTAFQLVSQAGNMVRLLSMGTYLLNMTFQVFLYCYQGNELLEESLAVSIAAYESGWQFCTVHIRKSVLVLMTRCRHPIRLSAGGFTALSLASFMAIIKASYSLFTLLQQVEDKRNN